MLNLPHVQTLSLYDPLHPAINDSCCRLTFLRRRLFITDQEVTTNLWCFSTHTKSPLFDLQQFLKIDSCVEWSRCQQIAQIYKGKSSRPEVFCKKGVLRNFSKFTGKHLCQSLFFNKVASLRPKTLLKKRLWHRCFPVNFEKFLRTPFLTKNLRCSLDPMHLSHLAKLVSLSLKKLLQFLVIFHHFGCRLVTCIAFYAGCLIYVLEDFPPGFTMLCVFFLFCFILLFFLIGNEYH